jgi:signal transduction histidine kinase
MFLSTMTAPALQPADNISGNGLSNMRQRLHNVGGSCFVESASGQGTTVRMRLRIKPGWKPYNRAARPLQIINL